MVKDQEDHKAKDQDQEGHQDKAKDQDQEDHKAKEGCHKTKMISEECSNWLKMIQEDNKLPMLKEVHQIEDQTLSEEAVASNLRSDSIN